MTFDEVKAAVARRDRHGACGGIVDMQGRLMGKRFHAAHFVDHGGRETHCCNYLLTTDIEMTTVQGYRSRAGPRATATT
jgi:glutamine synthetase